MAYFPAAEELRHAALQRYYVWSLKECDREVESGCLRLRAIKSRQTLGYVSLTVEWSNDAKVELLHGLVNRMHGRQLSEAQAKLVRSWDHAASAGYGPGDVALASEFLENNSAFRVDKKRLMRGLKNALSASVGAQTYSDGRTWQHRSEASTWNVLTNLDVGGATRQIEWTQDVLRGDELVMPATSPAQWFGLARVTALRYIRAGEEDSVCEAIAELCKYFIDSIDDMLNGISSD